MTVYVPPAWGVYLDFTREGRLFMDDSVNAISARIVTTANGFSATGTGTTEAGLLPGQHDRELTVSALAAVAGMDHGTRVAVISADGSPVLKVDGYAVRLARL